MYGIFGAEDILRASSVHVRKEIQLVADGVPTRLARDYFLFHNSSCQSHKVYKVIRCCTTVCSVLPEWGCRASEPELSNNTG